MFDGIIKTEGTYEFVSDPFNVEDGFYTISYTTANNMGNSLSFYEAEASFLRLTHTLDSPSPSTIWSIQIGLPQIYRLRMR
ncbi:MAG: hypothetical protein ACR2LL_13755 [Nitrosopumilus sp.]